MAAYHPTTATLPQPAPLPACPPEAVRIIPLGGIGEFGLNMLCYEMGGERIVVDCGAMIPEPDMPGVDLVIPDIRFLLEEPERLKAFFLTHGHDDHTAALPYLLQQIQAPVYGTGLTMAMLRAKLVEHSFAREPELHVMEYRKPTVISEFFEVEAISVTHSIPDAASLAIRTPAGTLIHTGDYKIDHAPISGEPFDFAAFTRLGEEGVLALVGDSTNSQVPGLTRNEQWVEEHLDPIFAASEGKIIASAFSSSVHRIQVLMDLADDYDRMIFLAGRSMERNVGIASELGFLHPPSRRLISKAEYRALPPERLLVLASGTQGEPMSALSRIAVGAHKQVQVEEGDTVIISARAIPGNARKINRLANHFCRHGARVYDSMSADVHASGHAYAEEMKLLLGLTRPRFVIPAHGDMRQLMAHRDLALDMGYETADVPILHNGAVLELHRGRAAVVGEIETGHVYVDGKTVGETGEVVLRDRQHLSEDGMLIAILNIDSKTGKLLGPPEIVTRGFVYVEESEALIEELRQVAREAFEASSWESREESDIINTEVRRALRRHIKREYQRFPLILPVVQEI